MKRLATILIAAAAVAGGFPGPAPAAVDLAGCADNWHDVEVPAPGLKVPERHVRVVVPDGYAESATGYPVVLLLHGAGDTYETWINNTDVEDFCENPATQAIIVMPDGGKNREAGWYSDWADGSRDWESFHIDVLLPWIHANYRTLGAGHLAVAGLSMGGFGAMSYAGRHPGLFDAAASFSGAVDTMHGWPANGFGYEAAHNQFGTPDDRVWGDHITNAEEWRAHNPADLAEELKETLLVLATGTGTPGGPAGDNFANPGGYAVEAFVFQLNVSFQAKLRLAGADFVDQGYIGGLHDWPYWQMALHNALPTLVSAAQSPDS